LLNYGQDEIMNLKNLRIFSQNMCKSHLLTDIILQNYKILISYLLKNLYSSLSKIFLACHLKRAKKSLVLPIILHELSFQDNQLTKINILESSPTLTFNSLNYISCLERILWAIEISISFLSLITTLFASWLIYILIISKVP